MATNEEKIKNGLVEAFPELADKINIRRPRRIFADVSPGNLRKVLDHVYNKSGFTMLCTITGLDNGSTFGAKYHFCDENGVVMSCEINVPRENPVIQSITDIFPAADKYERELMDLFGFKVEGLGPGKRYPLTDDWPAGQHPLRKDWKKIQSTESSEKHSAEVKNV